MKTWKYENRKNPGFGFGCPSAQVSTSEAGFFFFTTSEPPQKVKGYGPEGLIHIPFPLPPRGWVPTSSRSLFGWLSILGRIQPKGQCAARGRLGLRRCGIRRVVLRLPLRGATFAGAPPEVGVSRPSFRGDRDGVGRGGGEGGTHGKPTKLDQRLCVTRGSSPDPPPPPLREGGGQSSLVEGGVPSKLNRRTLCDSICDSGSPLLRGGGGSSPAADSKTTAASSCLDPRAPPSPPGSMAPHPPPSASLIAARKGPAPGPWGPSPAFGSRAHPPRHTGCGTKRAFGP